MLNSNRRCAAYSKEELTLLVASSYSIASVLRKLRVDARPNTYTWIKSLIDKFGISTAHFRMAYRTTTGGQGSTQTKLRVYSPEEVCPMPKIKQLLLKTVEYKCAVCGSSEWRGQKLGLELHHLDCNRLNNLANNLQLLCPNCHNIADHSPAKARRMARMTVITKSIKCDRCQQLMKYKTRSKLCRSCFNLVFQPHKDTISGRIVYRARQPVQIEQVLAEVLELGFVAVGKRYGVTDNAIRKWLKRAGLPVPTIKTMRKEKYKRAASDRPPK